MLKPTNLHLIRLGLESTDDALAVGNAEVHVTVDVLLNGLGKDRATDAAANELYQRSQQLFSKESIGELMKAELTLLAALRRAIRELCTTSA